MVEDQRRRLLDALADSIAERGYQATIVCHLTDSAGVSRRTFYDLFESKDDAFCIAHAEALVELGDAVRRVCMRQLQWPQKVRDGIDAAMRWMAAHPGRAGLIAVEPLTAGPHLGYCHDLLLARFGPDLAAGRSRSPVELPSNLEEMLLAGMCAIVATRLHEGRAASLPGLCPQLVELVLTPYLGIGQARRIAGSVLD